MDGRVVITLLRHGLTEENERLAYIGWTDSSLSYLGKKKVRQLKQQLASKSAENVFSSDLKRCIETAEILFPNKSIEIVKELREMHFGTWEGKTYEQLKDNKSYQNWLDNPFTLGPDGGETFQQFQQRINQGFEKIRGHVLNESLNHVAIVTHGGVIRFLLTKLTQSDNTYFDWIIPNGGGYQLTWDQNGFRRREVCTSLQAVPITENQHG